MKALRELAWVAMEEYWVLLELPPPMERRVFLLDSGGEGGECICVFGGNRDFVGAGIEIRKCTEKMSEKGGIDTGGRESAGWKPVGPFHHGLRSGAVELEQRKEGEEKAENGRLGSHQKRKDNVYDYLDFFEIRDCP